MKKEIVLHTLRPYLMATIALLIILGLLDKTSLLTIGGHLLTGNVQAQTANAGAYPPPASTPSPTATLPSYPPPQSSPTATATLPSYPPPQSSPTATATLPPYPPPQSSPTPTATPTPEEVPVIKGVFPKQGRVDLPNYLHVYGENFAAGVSARLGTAPLDPVQRMSSVYLRALLPAGSLSPGVYDLVVANPNGRSATRTDAYRVLPTDVDDLFGNGYELWTDPVALIAQERSQVGLVVHHQGGRQTVPPVDVRFYLGNPENGGTALGTGTTPPLPPHSSWSTSAVDWTPASTGSYTLYAVIDPANAISETVETNNVVSRTVTVWPPDRDETPPQVDDFSINNGEASTTEMTVTLKVSASDPTTPPPSSGMRRILFLEQEYVQGAGIWVPVQSSGWLDYLSTPSSYLWTVLPSAGVKYIQSWAADYAGNIAFLPRVAMINYIPPTDSIVQGEGRVFRYTLRTGENLTARVVPVSGDPDLYVWAPDYNDPTNPRPPWVSNNAGTTTEQVNFQAPTEGTYQIEVYGSTATTYQLTVSVTPAGEVNTNVQPEASVQGTAKDSPTEPIVPLDNEPSGYQGLPAAQRVHLAYLPFISPGAEKTSRFYFPVIFHRAMGYVSSRLYLPMIVR